jgi:hypothetical protein
MSEKRHIFQPEKSIDLFAFVLHSMEVEIIVDPKKDGDNEPPGENLRF